MDLPISDKKLRRTIEIQLGISGSTKEGKVIIEEIITNLKTNLPAAARTGANAIRDTSNALRDMTNEIRVGDRGWIDYAKSEKTAREENWKAVGSLKGLVSAFSAVGIELISLEKSFNVFTAFNKNLISVSGQFSKYGIGASKVEGYVNKLAKQTTLLRSETIQLMGSYEKGFNYANLARGESLMMHLKNAVGANAEAMKEMQGFLSGIVDKFPDLEQSITRLDAADKQRITAQSRLLFLSGQISFSESKRLRDYARQNQQASTEDEKRLQAAEKQVEAMNKLSAIMERIEMEVASKLAPYVEKFADWLDHAEQSLESWIGPLAKIVGLFTVLKSVSPIFKNGLLGKVGGGGGGLGGIGPTGLGGKVVAGAGAAYAAGTLYDAGYHAFTGKDMSANDDTSFGSSGFAAHGGKILSMTAAGGAVGGVPGAVVGAGMGMYQEITDTTEMVNKLREEGLRNELEAVNRLNTATDIFAKKAAAAKTPEEKAYYEKEQQASKLTSDAMDYGAKHQKGFFGHLTAGWFGEDEDEKKQNDMLRRAHEMHIANAKSAAGVKINSELSPSKAAPLALAAVSAKGLVSDSVGDVLGGMAREGPNAMAKQFSQSYAALRKAKDEAMVGNRLGILSPDELAQTGLSGLESKATLKASGPEFDTIENAAAKQKSKVQDLRAKGDITGATKEQGLLDKINETLNERARITKNIDDSEAFVDAQLNETVATSKQLTETYQAQKELMTATAEQMYLAGNVDSKALLDSAKEASALYKQNLDFKKLELEVMKEEDEVADQSLQKEIAKLQERLKDPKLSDEDRSNAERELQLETARQKLAKSRLASHEAEMKMSTAVANQASENLHIAEISLGVNQKMVEFHRAITSQMESQLALQMQFGNSGKQNTNLIKEMMQANDETVASLEKELTDWQATKELQKNSTEYQKREAEIVGQINQARSKGLQIMAEAANVNKANVDYQNAIVNKMEAEIQLADNLAMGVSASASMRMEAAKAIQEQINLEEKNKAALDEVIAAGKDDLALKLEAQGLSKEDAAKEAADEMISLATKRTEKETQILNLQQKQAGLLKSLRDGYIGAVQAMTSGTGIFAKVMMTQDKNLGVLLQNVKGVPQAMRTGGYDVTGGRSVGKRAAVGFGAGGVGDIQKGDADQKWQWDTHDHLKAIKDGVGDLRDSLLKVGKDFVDAANKGVTNQGANAVGANPYYSGQAMQGNPPNTVGTVGTSVTQDATKHFAPALSTAQSNAANATHAGGGTVMGPPAPSASTSPVFNFNFSEGVFSELRAKFDEVMKLIQVLSGGPSSPSSNRGPSQGR